MKQEFKLLKAIIRDYTPDEYSYDPAEGDRRAKQSDYDMVSVIPVSDPNAATMAQKVVQYQAVLQLAQTNPDIYDLPMLHRQMLEVLGIKEANKLIPGNDNMPPTDPVSENMNILNGKPVKAFAYQDHAAHITVHMSAAQDPQIQQIIGQSPNAQAIQGALQAHLAEHVAFEYRRRIEEMAGVPYPADNAEMDEKTEMEISRLAAAAAPKLLAQSQQLEAMKQAEQTAQDPIVQMQQQELQIKQQELELKKQKLALEMAAKNDQIELEQMRIQSQTEIAGLQVGAKISTAKEQLTSKEQEAGLRMGLDMAREAVNQGKAQAQPTKGNMNE
jgi:hypothetical protein